MEQGEFRMVLNPSYHAATYRVETMASSMRKTPNAARLYLREGHGTAAELCRRKRRQLVKKNEIAPKVGIEGQTKCRNEQ
jgi:hypothetical protein